MSLIRKPPAAERESSLRRAAEGTIATGKAVYSVGNQIGVRTARGGGKAVQIWLLGAFTFGALTASSFGAKVLGLLIMAPFWYFALRSRKRPAAADSESASSVWAQATAPSLVEPAFDPDAAISRYLEGRSSKSTQATELSPVPEQAQRPIFGKRMV